jgi:polygalacturonase
MPHPISRREFARLAGLSAAALSFAPHLRASGPPAPVWAAERDAILARLRPPAFPARDFSVADHGAAGDGRTDARPAFQEAVRRCNAAGGGRVVVPAGEWWLEGPLHLLSNVQLHLDERATLRFRTDDPALYLPVVLTRWEGTEVFNYSPFIYAYQAVNVALTGGGTLDGNALETFVKWRPKQGPDQQALRKLGAEGAPLPQRVFGAGHWLRPHFAQFFGCQNVLLDGFTLRDSPFWCTHAIASTNVTVRRLRVESAPVNSDGFDAESCSDVLVEDCRFDVGDDCVALKSGRDADGWRLGRPTENVVVRRCRFNNAVPAGSGLALGSEMSGGVRNVFAEDLEMDYAKVALNFKGNLDRGGAIERVRVRGVKVRKADTFIQFTTDYHGYRGGQHPPRFRDVVVEDATCAEAGQALHAMGVPAARLEDITLRRVAVARAEKKPELRHARRFALEEVAVNGAPLTSPADFD